MCFNIRTINKTSFQNSTLSACYSYFQFFTALTPVGKVAYQTSCFLATEAGEIAHFMSSLWRQCLMSEIYWHFCALLSTFNWDRLTWVVPEKGP